MPYNSNPPPPPPASGLKHGTKAWPYNPNPEKASRWATLGYTTTQALADEYSWLAQKFMTILQGSTKIPGSSYWTEDRLYTRMRRERLLPAYGGAINEKVLKRVLAFGRNVLNIKGLKMSVEGLEHVLIGESP